MQLQVNKPNKYIKTYSLLFLLLTGSVSLAMLPKKKKVKTGDAATKELRRAIIYGDLQGITTAIDQGADANGRFTVGGGSAHSLSLAIMFNHSDEQAAKTLQILIENGAKVDGAEPRALYDAAHRGFEACQRLLLKHGAQVNSRTRNGLTPLHGAVGGNSPCSVLLAAGADPTIRNNSDKMPLHVAADKLHPRFVKELVANIPVHQIIEKQRDLAFCLLCCFKKFEKKEGVAVTIPKDIQRMLCRYAIRANVDTLVEKRIAWLQKYFTQKACGKTALELFKKSVKKMPFTEYFEGTYNEFANVINLKNIDQHRPTICATIEKVTGEIILWSNKKVKK